MNSAPRQKSAWVWLAILAISAAAVVRAEGGVSGSAPYAQSMLRFLAAHQDSESLTAGVPHLLDRWSGALFARSAKPAVRNAHRGIWLSMLPVVFVGLAAPLSLARAVVQLRPNRAHAAALLPACYRRPPPSRLA